MNAYSHGSHGIKIWAKNDTPRKCTGVPRVGTLKATLK